MRWSKADFWSTLAYFRKNWAGFWETASYISVVLALIVAFIEYDRNKGKEEIDSAWGIYREVDHAYIEYTKLCLDHPRLDCYTEPQTNPPTTDLSATERIQQKILYDILTDVYESAYVHFVKFRDHLRSEEGKKILRDQWGGWDNYIEKFLIRPAYLSVWLDVYRGYDDEMQCHMKDLIEVSVGPEATEKLEPSLQVRLNDWRAEISKQCSDNPLP